MPPSLGDLEEEARGESEFEREERVRFGIDVEREIAIERADEEIHHEICLGRRTRARLLGRVSPPLLFASPFGKRATKSALRRRRQRQRRQK